MSAWKVAGIIVGVYVAINVVTAAVLIANDKAAAKA